MLLDRIDIDAHGPLSRVELGPFSEQLNVICGPEGSGKTAIARFIRDSLVHREYPLGMMSSSTGRVVWADRHGLLHCRREKDGTATGRRTVQFDPRGDFVDQYDSLRRSWISSVLDSTDSSRAAGAIQIPESIVDGVITDTAVSSVARVVSACIRSGLDDSRHLPSNEGTEPEETPQRRSLRAQLADVEAELAGLQVSETEYQALTARRNDLTNKLAGQAPKAHTAPICESIHPQGDLHLADLQRRIQRLQSRQHELRQTIVDLDRRISGLHQAEASRVKHSHHYSTHAHRTDEELRRRLDDLDAQMIRWRRTLKEVHALRDALTRYAGDAAYHYGSSEGPLEDVVTRRRRLNGLLHSVDRYEHRSHLDPYQYASRPLSSEDIDVRIDAATRQIDWLLERYVVGDNLVADWYQAVPTSTYGANTTVAETLRAIRDDLSEVRQRTHRPIKNSIGGEYYYWDRSADLDELHACERWLSASIDQLVAQRDSLVSAYDPEASRDFVIGDGHSDSLLRERSRRINELDRVIWESNEVTDRVAQLRNERPEEPASEVRSDRAALVAEVRRIDDRLARVSRAQWLRTRRSQLMHELGVVHHHSHAGSPLAEAASRWLVRLSAGRLRRVDWPYAAFKSASLAHSIHLDRQRTGVCIDGRDESDCPAADRALAVLAVRMAAADVLAKTGRSVPLVLETHRELLQAINVYNKAYLPANGYGYGASHHDWTAAGRHHHPIAAALHDYTRAGRQVVLLTSSQTLANQIRRDGGRGFQLFANRTVHPHRPIWRPHYAAERYVGPHPHTYGAELAPDHRTDENYSDDSTNRGSHYPQQVPLSSHRAIRGVDDVNRNFDMAWREAYGLYDNPDRYGAMPETDWARDGVDYRDGYYVGESFTTSRPLANGATTTTQLTRPAEKRSPFFLSVDSPIDQAPSIDAVAAARLRGLKITHINHLMQQDSNRLADALGLSNVDAATIRRWQSECRLCCRVPQLRGFDSRVLVGCGVSDPAQLAAIHPTDLLERVESFLATDPGQRILRTGSSHELSRITSWIASARSTNSDRNTVAFGPGRVVNGRVIQPNQSPYAFDSDRYEYEGDEQQRSRQRRGQGQSRTRRSTRRVNGRRYGIDPVNGNGTNNGYGQASANGQSRKSSRARRDVVSMEREPLGDGRDYNRRETRRRARSERSARSTKVSSGRDLRNKQTKRDSEHELRFYLQRESPVVDAPSIGARLAERLNEAGIDTVDDLINADPETLAAELDHRRVDAETIEAWQQQATLVCRIPMLRGHDAQLLVAADVTTTEEVAASDPAELFSLIDPISRSGEGKRIIRGGKLPDLDEVTDWIRFAQQNRDLMAA